MLLDVKMPGDGVSMTVRRMKQISPRTVVIILTMCDESSLVRRLIEEDRGYLLKSVTGGELVAAIRSARSGGRLTLAVSDRSMWEHRDGDLLSRREREILELAARALSNAQIADRLFVAEATVKRHLHNAFRKLGAVSRRRGQQGQGGLDDLHGRGVRAGAGTPAGQDRPERPAGTAQNARLLGPPRMPACRHQRLPNVPTAGLAAGGALEQPRLARDDLDISGPAPSSVRRNARAVARHGPVSASANTATPVRPAPTPSATSRAAPAAQPHPPGSRTPTVCSP